MYHNRRMEMGAVVVLLSTLLALGLAEPARFTGFIGCRFSKLVCQPEEECFDDNLFGSCQRGGRQGEPTDSYQFQLDRGTLRLLEEEISRLVVDGYTWTSLYTQCVVGNVLLAYRLGIEHDSKWCDKGGAPPARYQEALTDDSKAILADYINDYYSQSEDTKPALLDDDSDDVIDVEGFPPIDASAVATEEGDYPQDLPQKKDEFVDIHKYWADKRNYDQDLDGNGGFRGDSEPGYYRIPDPDEQQGGISDDLNSLVDELGPRDLILLESYLRNIGDGEGEREEEERLLEDEEEKEARFEGAELPYQMPYEGSEMGENEMREDAMRENAMREDAMREDAMREDAMRENEMREDEMREDVGERPRDESLGYVWRGEDQPLTEDQMMQPVFDNVMETLPEDDRIPLEEPVATEDFPEQGYVPDRDALTLSPPDAKLLGDLLQDKVDVETLSDDQIQRLLTHVDNMLITTEQRGQSEPEGENSVEDMMSNKRAPVISDIEEPHGPIGMDSPDPTQALPDPHDNSFNEDSLEARTAAPKLAVLNTLQGYMHVTPIIKTYGEGQHFLDNVGNILNLPEGSLKANSVQNGDINFEVVADLSIDAAYVAKEAMRQGGAIQNQTLHTLEDAGVGDDKDKLSITAESTVGRNGPKYFVLTFVLCGCIAGIVLAVVALYIVRRHSRSKQKLQQLAATGDGAEASKDYQDLCRQRMQSKSSEKSEPSHAGAARVSSVASETTVRSPSSRSSTSSWSEEPVASNMDISTGHIVLSYMEDHLKNKDRLDEEWEGLCAYEAEPSTTGVGSEASNMRKNRYSDVLPYDHSRVILSSTPNVSGSDYINANTITDHDPRNPAYIATQGPLPHTVADFWQMVWEQGSVVIVQLTKLTENGVAMCHRYWPEEGSDLYHIYEVHLVSEHIWCDDYLVRSFYLKNLQTNETRTVTQFHFLTWPDLGVPSSAKALLDFRRKVNKSYRGRSCPIVVHCSDGVGRTGTYSLIDMVLNRMSKGAKEIDIAATLEHIRDQRANMVKTKEQFEFALAAVAEEVHAILKALPQ